MRLIDGKSTAAEISGRGAGRSVRRREAAGGARDARPRAPGVRRRGRDDSRPTIGVPPRRRRRRPRSPRRSRARRKSRRLRFRKRTPKTRRGAPRRRGRRARARGRHRRQGRGGPIGLGRRLPRARRRGARGGGIRRGPRRRRSGERLLVRARGIPGGSRRGRDESRAGRRDRGRAAGRGPRGRAGRSRRLRVRAAARRQPRRRRRREGRRGGYAHGASLRRVRLPEAARHIDRRRGLSNDRATARAPRSSWSSVCSWPPPPPCSTGAREVLRTAATDSPSRSPRPARARPSPNVDGDARPRKACRARDSRRDRSDRRAHARAHCDGRSLRAPDRSARPTDGNPGTALSRGDTSAAFRAAAAPPGPSAVAAGLDGESGSGREERELRPERALHRAARAGLRDSLAHRSVRRTTGPPARCGS